MEPECAAGCVVGGYPHKAVPPVVGREDAHLAVAAPLPRPSIGFRKHEALGSVLVAGIRSGAAGTASRTGPAAAERIRRIDVGIAGQREPFPALRPDVEELLEWHDVDVELWRRHGGHERVGVVGHGREATDVAACHEHGPFVTIGAVGDWQVCQARVVGQDVEHARQEVGASADLHGHRRRLRCCPLGLADGVAGPCQCAEWPVEGAWVRVIPHGSDKKLHGVHVCRAGRCPSGEERGGEERGEFGKAVLHEAAGSAETCKNKPQPPER